jgi:hypothetical protein
VFDIKFKIFKNSPLQEVPIVNQLLSPFTIALRLRASRKLFFMHLTWSLKCKLTPLFLFDTIIIGFVSDNCPK